MIESSAEALELIAQVFENAEKSFYEILADIPSAYQKRVEEVIIDSLRSRIEEYDANKKKEKDSSIIKIFN